MQPKDATTPEPRTAAEAREASAVGSPHAEPYKGGSEAQARPAVASEHPMTYCEPCSQCRQRLASDTRSVGALDVERLARALLHIEEKRKGGAYPHLGPSWKIGEIAAAIAAAYDAEAKP